MDQLLKQGFMKHLLLLISTALILITSTTAQSGDSFIVWSPERPLAWEDFKGKPNKTSPYHAQTQGTLNYEFESLGPGSYTFKLNVRFDEKKSWAKPNETTDNLMDHEQGHFDIYEIYGRLIMKRIKESNVLETKEFSDGIAKIFKTTFTELRKFQREYDNATDHSKNKEQQIKWRKKLQDRLDQLKGFKHKEIEFNV